MRFNTSTERHLLAAFIACTAACDDGRAPGQPSSWDAGSSPDEGVATDSGPPEAGGPSDAGPSPGEPPDAGSHADAGLQPDGGTLGVPVRTATLTASQGDFLDALGSAMSFSGSDLFISAPNDELDGEEGSPACGAVYRFEPDPSAGYGEVGRLLPPECLAGLRFGRALAATDRFLAVGAPSESVEPRVALYAVGETSVDFIDERIEASGAGFGATLALSDSMLIVGAPLADSSRGQVHAYRIEQDGLHDIALPLSPALTGDRQGQGLALHPDGWLAVGSSGVDGGGSVEVLRREGDRWRQIALLENPDVDDRFAAFGASLSFSSRALWVGAPGSTDGVIYRYRMLTNGGFGQPEAAAGPPASGVGLGVSVAASLGTELRAFGGPLAIPGVALIIDEERELGWFVADLSLPGLALFGASVAVALDRPVVAVGIPGWRPPGSGELEDGDTGAVAIYELR